MVWVNVRTMVTLTGSPRSVPTLRPMAYACVEPDFAGEPSFSVVLTVLMIS